VSRADFARRTPTTIVVPAHNEGAVIGRCLAAVLGDAEPDEFSVLVVSNGSTDDTVEQAREAGEKLGRPVEVLEVNVASKIAALRAAEAHLDGHPGSRIYLDADVVLSTDGARRLADALQTDEPRLALARIDVDTSASSWLVRRYYDAWTSTGYIDRQDAGSGVFALNQAGVARVSPLPEVVNDDGYVARCFGDDERVVCDTGFRSFAARSAVALVRRRARIVNGNRQLDSLYPRERLAGSSSRSASSSSTSSSSSGGTRADLLMAVRERRLPATSALVFLVLTVAARALAWWRRATGSAHRWSTDTTTRKARESTS
jgi:glycosyltransferase involved in cell wall biosynthesis